MNRFLLLFLLRRLHHGRIVLGEGERRMQLGEPSDLAVEVRVNDRAAYRHALLRGSTGLADGYVDGRWDCDDLVGLIRIGARNAGGPAEGGAGSRKQFPPRHTCSVARRGGTARKTVSTGAGTSSRAVLSRYSHVRMEAKQRTLDEIAARQRAADTSSYFTQ
jgi:hypothetical protein